MSLVIQKIEWSQCSFKTEQKIVHFGVFPNRTYNIPRPKSLIIFSTSNGGTSEARII